MKQKPELIGQEAMAAEAVRGQIVLERFDVVLGLASVGVLVVELGRRKISAVGDHETPVDAQGVDLHLGHDPAGAIPALGPVEKPGEVSLLLLMECKGLLTLVQPVLDGRFQTGIAS